MGRRRRRAACGAAAHYAHDALAGIAKGADVYLFLTGMMLLAEIAREEGLFDWLAARRDAACQGLAARGCSC